MGIEIDSLGNIITTSDTNNVTSGGRKINLLNHPLTITEVGQSVFTLPFTYVTGDVFDVYINNNLQKDFTVVGETFTWLGYTLDTDDELIIWG